MAIQKKVQNRRAYPLQEEWYKTMNWLLDKCDKMPARIRFTVSGRIANLALSIQEELIRAAYAPKEQQGAILVGINLLLEQLRLYMRLCKDRHYISIDQYQYASESINTCGRLCGGWIKSVKV